MKQQTKAGKILESLKGKSRAAKILEALQKKTLSEEFTKADESKAAKEILDTVKRWKEKGGIRVRAQLTYPESEAKVANKIKKILPKDCEFWTDKDGFGEYVHFNIEWDQLSDNLKEFPKMILDISKLVVDNVDSGFDGFTLSSPIGWSSSKLQLRSKDGHFNMPLDGMTKKA